MKEIYNLSLKYGFKIIEDASHALGGVYKKNKIGSCKYSVASAFSFHAIKHIAMGEGGCVTTNNNNLSEMIRLKLNHGMCFGHNKLFLFQMYQI